MNPDTYYLMVIMIYEILNFNLLFSIDKFLAIYLNRNTILILRKIKIIFSVKSSIAPGDVNKKLTFVVIFLSPFMKANWQGGLGSEIQKLMQIKIYINYRIVV